MSLPQPWVIVECASSHAGYMDEALRLIHGAADAGADVVKFQSYQVRHLDPADPQYVWLANAELTDSDHELLMATCADRGVKFLTTAFHEDRIPFLAGLKLPAIKIGSGEGMRRPLLEAVARHPWRVYLSTGLSTASEIRMAMKILEGHDVMVMHTVNRYPTPAAAAALDRMAWLRDLTGYPVGYSDHTHGIDAAYVALSLGAACVEVHVASHYRHNLWDKDFMDVHRLWAFAQRVPLARTWTPQRVAPETRPYVGRWAHGE
jgi:sialic acid synthase SpsE